MSRRPGTPLVVGGAVLLAVVLGVTLLAPVIAPYDPAAQLAGEPLSGPSRAHWLGTDRYGRDLASRVLLGGRETLLLTGLTLVAVLVAGTVIGSLVAVAGPRIDAAGRHLIDLLVGFPAVVVALALVGLRGPSLPTVLTGVLLVMWAPFARLARSLVRTALAEPSAETARALGSGRLRLLRVEAWPRLRGPLLVLAAVESGQLIAVVAGLSFLGLGAQPPTPEWGAMLQDARSHLTTSPHVVLAPGGAVLVTVLALTVLGEGLRDRFDLAGQEVLT